MESDGYDRTNGQVTLLGQALTNRPYGATFLLSHTPWQVEQAAQAEVQMR